MLFSQKLASYQVNLLELLDPVVLCIERMDAMATGIHISEYFKQTKFKLKIKKNSKNKEKSSHLGLAAFLEIVCKLTVCRSLRFLKPALWKGFVRHELLEVNAFKS